MTRERLWGFAFWVAVLAALAIVLWGLYRPPPSSVPVTPTPTIAVTVLPVSTAMGVEAAPSPTATPTATRVPTENVLTTPTSTPITPSPTATETPTRAPATMQQKG